MQLNGTTRFEHGVPVDEFKDLRANTRYAELDSQPEHADASAVCSSRKLLGSKLERQSSVSNRPTALFSSITPISA